MPMQKVYKQSQDAVILKSWFYPQTEKENIENAGIEYCPWNLMKSLKICTSV